MNKKAVLISVLIVSLVIAIIISKKIYSHEKWQSSHIHLLQEQNESLIEKNEELQKNILELSDIVDELNGKVKYSDTALKWQSEQIDLLQEQNESLIEKNERLQKNILELSDTVGELNGKVNYSDTAFNYLAIGNSITFHGLADYWWNEIGMAASTEENDYVHLVANYLKESYGEVCFYVGDFYIWEIQAHDRAETYDVINKYLNSKLDLVTIQLSENVSDLSTFEVDFEALINHVKQEAPNAKIMIIDDFWNNGVKAEAKKEAAANTNVIFVSLDEIKGDAEYKCGLGTTVYGIDGKPHIVEHEGVAGHPGDKGMKYIAGAIIKSLQ